MHCNIRCSNVLQSMSSGPPSVYVIDVSVLKYTQHDHDQLVLKVYTNLSTTHQFEPCLSQQRSKT